MKSTDLAECKARIMHYELNNIGEITGDDSNTPMTVKERIQEMLEQGCIPETHENGSDRFLFIDPEGSTHEEYIRELAEELLEWYIQFEKISDEAKGMSEKELAQYLLISNQEPDNLKLAKEIEQLTDEFTANIITRLIDCTNNDPFIIEQCKNQRFIQRLEDSNRIELLIKLKQVELLKSIDTQLFQFFKSK